MTCQPKLIICLLLVYTLWIIRANAHSLPNTFAEIRAEDHQVLILLKTPLDILELASKLPIDLSNPKSLESIKNYYLQHISITDSLHSTWQIYIDTLYIHQTTDAVVGEYDEVIAKVYLNPTKKESLYSFLLHCDLVIHQVANQSILFSVLQHNHHKAVEVGAISVDYATGKILPFKINLNRENEFASFGNMMFLGIQHIKEGTDHLLFIFTLLLPACLLANNNKWTTYGGVKYSVFKLLKITTAFTIGHSVTLIIGSIAFSKIPIQLIEITIAFSIVISAIHAIKPLFYNKEIWIAIGFGFIHGLAFSQTLQDLQLEKSDLLISVLGFNIGIEAMQILIISITMPWFMMMSKTRYFKTVKNILSIFIGIAAMGWMFQRITDSPNFISEAIDQLFLFSPWLIFALAMLTLALVLMDKKSKIKILPEWESNPKSSF